MMKQQARPAATAIKKDSNNSMWTLFCCGYRWATQRL